MTQDFAMPLPQTPTTTSGLSARLRDRTQARHQANALQVRTPQGTLTTLIGASEQRGATQLAARLGGIHAWLEDDLIGVEHTLRVLAGRGADLADRAASHLLARPGKRVRPMCVLLASRLGEHQTEQEVVLGLAVAAELTHAATLLHDDVLDNADERRGAPSARAMFGNAVSVLGGDHLLIEALRRVSLSGEQGLLLGLFDAVGEMIAAEALQLAIAGKFEPCADNYHAIIGGKTAALFRWALRAGGTVAGLAEEHLEALERAGTAFGFAFQLIDDALDLDQAPEVMGKDACQDLREGKLTWPLICAAERDPAVADILAVGFADATVREDDAWIASTRARLIATGCTAATRERARAFVRTAQLELARLPRTEAREALQVLTASAVARTK
ncbi:MAG: octaprenyl-diphosphate synthase [Myxococcota bacterium]|jgi:octaprenyl-diphosphate synthase